MCMKIACMINFDKVPKMLRVEKTVNCLNDRMMA